MLYLITGGSGSGKSEYAEKLAVSLNPDNKRMIYLATMSNHGREASERISRHRQMRAGRGFDTIESMYLDSPADELKGSRLACILLEDLSNLISNYMFARNVDSVCTEDILKDRINCLTQLADNLIIVTNEVFSDGSLYDESVSLFMQVLSNLNKYIADSADFFTEVVVGIPVDIKTK